MDPKEFTRLLIEQTERQQVTKDPKQTEAPNPNEPTWLDRVKGAKTDMALDVSASMTIDEDERIDRLFRIGFCLPPKRHYVKVDNEAKLK